MALVITDDQTHKKQSPFMHICCSYRPIGCPFILRLVRAVEGGWEMRTGGKWESETRLGSNYRCRHDAAMGGSYSVDAAKKTGGPGRPKAPKKKAFGGSIPQVVPTTTGTGRPERMAAMRQREREAIGRPMVISIPISVSTLIPLLHTNDIVELLTLPMAISIFHVATRNNLVDHSRSTTNRHASSNFPLPHPNVFHNGLLSSSDSIQN